MNRNLDAFVDERVIREGESFCELSESSNTTLFLGLFNGEEFLDSTLYQLQSQSALDFPILIVDNCSSDSTWARILSWPADILKRSKLIRNPVNVGGVGTLWINLDEIKTDWLSVWHQDDYYLENHMKEHIIALEAASADVAVVFSDMGSIDGSGQKVPTILRQSWVANLGSAESRFLANLFLQIVSYPSSSLRKASLVGIEAPWHSASFNDTEITLLQAPDWRFVFVRQRTMLYRMNPESASNELDAKERALGPFASLNRVFSSESFFRLCLRLKPTNRTKFAKSVFKGIEVRLGNNELTELVKLVASETMATAWAYSEGETVRQIHAVYRVAESKKTLEILEGLGIRAGLSPSVVSIEDEHGADTKNQALVELLSESKGASNTPGSSFEKSALTFLSFLLPLPLRRIVVARIVLLAARFRKNSPWNFDWRR
jgi:glycosyltransferase involved in cell wall biosynthesis